MRESSLGVNEGRKCWRERTRSIRGGQPAKFKVGFDLFMLLTSTATDYSQGTPAPPPRPLVHSLSVPLFPSLLLVLISLRLLLADNAPRAILQGARQRLKRSEDTRRAVDGAWVV